MLVQVKLVSINLILIEFLPLPCKNRLLLSVRDNIILKTPITEWVFLWLVMIWHWCGWRYEKKLLLKKEERAETSTILNSCDADRECKREVKIIVVLDFIQELGDIRNTFTQTLWTN